MTTTLKFEGSLEAFVLYVERTFTQEAAKRMRVTVVGDVDEQAAGGTIPFEAAVEGVRAKTHSTEKISAVVAVRNATGWLFQESKDFVEEHWDDILAEAKPEPTESDLIWVCRKVLEVPNSGKIHCIKEVRQSTGWSLKEAKDFVEEHTEEIGL